MIEVVNNGELILYVEKTDIGFSISRDPGLSKKELESISEAIQEYVDIMADD